MKTLKNKSRNGVRANSTLKHICKCEKQNEIRTNSSMGFFESMTMFK